MVTRLMKLLKRLEDYVQWGILSLGVLFLAYICWTYIYLNPAAQPFPGSAETATAGNVDKLIADGSGATLEQRIHEVHPEFQIPVHIDAAVDLSGATTRPVVAESQPVWDSWQVDLDKAIPKLDIGSFGGKVAALPALPALQYVDQEPLRTLLLVNGAHQDQDAVTTFWRLPVSDLAKAYRDALRALPQPKQTALIVRTVLIRQEQLPSGDWGNDTPIPLALPTTVAPPPPYPQAGQDASAYLAWVSDPTNQPWLVAPAFPTVAFDANSRPDLQWQDLGAWLNYRAKEQASAALPVADAAAAAPVTTPPAPTSPPAPAGPFAGGRGGFGGNGSGGSRQFSPGGGPPPLGAGHRHGGHGSGGGAESAGGAPPPAGGAEPPPEEPPQEPPPQEPPPAPANPFAPAAGGGQTPEQLMPEPAVNVPPVEVPKLQAPPKGEFSPYAAVSGGDMELYFHDLTVEPGRTYRYKVQYTLLNPIYNDPNQDPKLASVFGIDSPESDWSSPVAVPSRTRFWCTARQPLGLGDGEIAFSVFSWHDGMWQQKDCSASAGDEIGSSETGNFLTGWTLLDVKTGRAGSVERFVLLTPDDGGAAQERSVLADAASQEYKHFMHDFNAQPKPDNSAGGAATQPSP